MSVTLADASDALNSYVVTRLVKSFLVVGTHTNCISSHAAGTNTSSLHSRPTVDAASVNEAVADIIRLCSRSGVAPCKLALLLGPILQYCPYFCATKCD